MLMDCFPLAFTFYFVFPVVGYYQIYLPCWRSLWQNVTGPGEVAISKQFLEDITTTIKMKLE